MTPNGKTSMSDVIAAQADEIIALRAANERIGAMVEWLAEVIVDAREACDRTESIQPQGSPDWVESGIAMRKTVLHEVRKVLNRERTAHPSALDRVTAERDEAIRHKVEMDDLRRQAKAERDEARVAIDRVRALCDDEDARWRDLALGASVVSTRRVRAAIDGGA